MESRLSKPQPIVVAALVSGKLPALSVSSPVGCLPDAGRGDTLGASPLTWRAPPSRSSFGMVDRREGAGGRGHLFRGARRRMIPNGSGPMAAGSGPMIRAGSAPSSGLAVRSPRHPHRRTRSPRQTKRRNARRDPQRARGDDRGPPRHHGCLVDRGDRRRLDREKEVTRHDDANANASRRPAWAEPQRPLDPVGQRAISDLRQQRWRWQRRLEHVRHHGLPSAHDGRDGERLAMVDRRSRGRELGAVGRVVARPLRLRGHARRTWLGRWAVRLTTEAFYAAFRTPWRASRLRPGHCAPDGAQGRLTLALVTPSL